MKRSDWIEYVRTCIAGSLFYTAIAHFVGFERVPFGLVPSAMLHALLLWYNFAIKTHEGYSVGAAETRSHNYYGKAIFYFSFGLSMHRLHHMQPRLAWLQMAQTVAPGTWIQRLRLERDICHADFPMTVLPVKNGS